MTTKPKSIRRVVIEPSANGGFTATTDFRAAGNKPSYIDGPDEKHVFADLNSLVGHLKSTFGSPAKKKAAPKSQPAAWSMTSARMLADKDRDGE